MAAIGARAGQQCLLRAGGLQLREQLARRPSGAFGRGSRCCGASAPRPSHAGHWQTFCGIWNDTLARRPTAMIIFFSGSATTTWATIYCALSAFAAASPTLAAPEFAVGWLVMRTTTRLRMPLNVALATMLSRYLPWLGELKVSPLLAAVATDEESRAKLQEARERIEQSPRLGKTGQQLAKRWFEGASRFVRWVEGPIDKYGLACFLMAKTTNVATLSGATIAAAYGLDIPAAMTSWGLSGELQNASGLVACTAALNVTCVPLHFLGTVSAVHVLERFGTRLWHERQKDIAERLISGTLTEEEQNEPEVTQAQMQVMVVSLAAALTLALDLSFSLYLMRTLYKSQTKAADTAAVAGDLADDHAEAAEAEGAAEDPADEAAGAAGAADDPTVEARE